jgi:outer membrane protein OmpA-like peptidoglycan-associated protein
LWLAAAVAALALAGLTAGCAQMQGTWSGGGDERVTERDKTKKGAGIGAAAGAVLGAVLGEGEADEILAGAAIGAGIGAGVGAYMDRQEEKLAEIPGTQVERLDEDMLLVKFDSDVLFAFDSAELSAESRLTLTEMSEVLLEYPKTAVVVQGHTDSTGSEEYNQRLSERRAEAVRLYLIDEGVVPGRVNAMGYGETAPVASNASEDGRALNRRVNILLKAKAR